MTQSRQTPRHGPSRQVLRAVLRLREMILSGDLPPTQRVAELHLVGTVGVSRTPLRLAMERLEHEGLLARRPGGGFVVREFTFREVQRAIELRGSLEGMACRFAAARTLSEKALAPIRETLEGIHAVLQGGTQSLEASARYADLNARFHAQLIELADSPLLSRLVEQVVSVPFTGPSALIRVHATAAEEYRISIAAEDQHRTIVEAIAQGDGARAEAVAREHARLALRHLEAAARDRESFRRLPGGTLVRFG